MTEVPPAVLCHAAAGRLRIRIPARRGDVAYFAALEQSLAAAPGVDRASVRPMTGSVVIHHASDPSAIGAFARDHGLFDLQDGAPPVAPVAAGLRSVAATVDERLRSWAGGGLDLATLLSLVYLAAALVQMRNGRFFGPASSLLWSAIGALRLARTPPSPARE